MFDINFADGWIQTMNLWYRKQMFYQLSRKHWFGSYLHLNFVSCFSLKIVQFPASFVYFHHFHIAIQG